MNKSLSETLKEHTAPQHKEVESHIGIMSPDFAVNDYKNYLLFLENFYSINEPQLLAFTQDFPELELPKRLKHSHLMKDIKAFSGTPEALIKGDLKVPVENESSLFGYLYVTEGSTLGGLHIAKHFTKKFGEDEVPTNFLNCYQDQAFDYWDSFKSVLNSKSDRIDRDDLLQTAVTTFEKFKTFKKSLISH